MITTIIIGQEINSKHNTNKVDKESWGQSKWFNLNGLTWLVA